MVDELLRAPRQEVRGRCEGRVTYLALAVFFSVAIGVGVLIERHLSRDDAKTRGLAAANRGLTDDGKGEGN
jgi:hypothetical protein